MKTEEIAIWVTRPFFPELSYERLLKQTDALITKVIYGGRSKARDTYLGMHLGGQSVDQYARSYTTTDGWNEHRVRGVKHHGVHCGLERVRLNCLFDSVDSLMLRERDRAVWAGFDDPFDAWIPDGDRWFWQSPSQSETRSNGRVTKHLSPLPYSAIAREWPFSLVIDNGEDIIQPTKRRRQSPSPLD